jgi:uncharacterized membrane protein YgdD (TMEM256/DUF423 family)
MINNKILALIGALLLVISISLGALGAHALSEILTEERFRSFLTANQYLTIHGLAFLVLALFPAYILKSTRIILAGLLLFSGSIFLLITLGHHEIGFPKILFLITPLGGLLMIAGWFVLVFRLWKGGKKI